MGWCIGTTRCVRRRRCGRATLALPACWTLTQPRRPLGAEPYVDAGPCEGTPGTPHRRVYVLWLQAAAEAEAHFHALCRTIIYQQLAGSAARAIDARFAALFAPPAGWVGDAAQYRPSAVQVLEADPTALRGAGLSAQKAAYLQDLAAHTVDGRLMLSAFAVLPDAAVAAQLQAVRGIGPWTAHMHLLFHLGRGDVLPVGDLGVRKGIMRHFCLRQLPSPAEMVRLTAPWRPHRSLGAWLMWRLADDAPPTV
jgi:DNA-3-methyladenine glycosylase II